jgi:tetratricopeptide (TPR) repeat protein
MAAYTGLKNYLLKISLILFLAFCCTGKTFSQKQKADSIIQLLVVEKTDSIRVKLLWNLANIIYRSNPDTALKVGQEALSLARSIKYTEGESRSLGVIASTFSKIGNYPRALDFNLQKLKIEEKRNNPQTLAGVLMNIGTVYVLQDEYRKALEFYSKSDSVIEENNLSNEYKYAGYLNIGDAYDKLNILDSAQFFYNQANRKAIELQDDNSIGASMTGLGHIYRKESNFALSYENYKSAIKYLVASDDDDLLCEVNLGLASLYNQFNKRDSAIYHAKISYQVAKQDGFLSRQLDAAKFLSQAYKQTNNIDSTLSYLLFERDLNDSINNKNSIRESQILSSNELLRQLEIAKAKKEQDEQRRQQLQLLFIGIFIPGLFLLTLFLSRVKLHIRVIKLLGILSLLIFFEYLTLLLHPRVAEFTHHTPVFEILIFVAVAAILIPLHHKAEHWLIHKLLHLRAARKEKEN